MSSQSDTTIHVLAIHAHPNDVELRCAGTLLKLQNKGCRISIATMTAGDTSSTELPPEEIAAIRRTEAKTAATLLKAEYTCLEFQDLQIVFDNDSRRRVTEFIRRSQPDLILAASPIDCLLDHEITSQLVRDACLNSSVPNYKTRQWDPAPATTKAPHLYYMDSLDGADIFGNRHSADFVVDVSDVFEAKQQVQACHSRQTNDVCEPLSGNKRFDISHRCSQQRGSEIGAAYAEGFRQHKGALYPTDNLLSKLLTD